MCKIILFLDKDSIPVSNDEIIGTSPAQDEVDNHVEDDDLDDFIKTKTSISSIQEINEDVETIPIV